MQGQRPEFEPPPRQGWPQTEAPGDPGAMRLAAAAAGGMVNMQGSGGYEDGRTMNSMRTDMSQGHSELLPATSELLDGGSTWQPCEGPSLHQQPPVENLNNIRPQDPIGMYADPQDVQVPDVQTARGGVLSEIQDPPEEPTPRRAEGESDDSLRKVHACAEALTNAELQELRALGRPHATVREVVETSLMLLGYRDATWAASRRYFDRPGVFLEKMRTFDASRMVSRLQYQKLCRGLSQGTFEEGNADHISVAAGKFARWCRAVGEVLARRYNISPTPARTGAPGRVSARGPGTEQKSARGAPENQQPMQVKDADHGGPRPPQSQKNCGIPRPQSMAGFDIIPDIYQIPMNELRRVTDLTIRRPGVGEVTFHGDIDMTRGNILEDLPNVVRLQPGEVVLYPEPGTKPVEGEGLNRPATITLHQCMPPNNGNFPDADSKRRYRERIAQMTEAKGARFVDYDCDNGIWRFRVDHF